MQTILNSLKCHSRTQGLTNQAFTKNTAVDSIYEDFSPYAMEFLFNMFKQLVICSKRGIQKNSQQYHE